MSRFIAMTLENCGAWSKKVIGNAITALVLHCPKNKFHYEHVQIKSAYVEH